MSRYRCHACICLYRAGKPYREVSSNRVANAQQQNLPEQWIWYVGRLPNTGVGEARVNNEDCEDGEEEVEAKFAETSKGVEDIDHTVFVFVPECAMLL